MRKKLSLCFLILFAAVAVNGQSLFQLSFKNIDGDTVLLNTFSGKKILFFIVPLNQADSNFSQLQSFKSRYGDTVRVIGIPSFEDGFQMANAAALKSLYSNMGIVLTQGMYTKKTSGANQSALMRWLTDRTKNQHYDMDAAGVGHKFFVTATGRQYAVMPPPVPLTSPIIHKIVHSKD